MNQYRLTVYTCPYCSEKSNGSVCLHSDCKRLREVNRQYREAMTAQMQFPLALEAIKLRSSIKRRKEQAP